MNTALKKKLIKTIGIISVLLVLTVCGLYIARNSLLKISMDRRIAQAKREQGLSISYQSLELKGVSHIEMNGLAIIPEQRDTLLQLQTLRLEFNFWKLFGGHLEVKDVQLDKLKIQLIKRDSIANYDFLFQKEKKETPSKKEEYNYAKRADELLELAFDLLPENGEIRHLSVTHQRDTNLIEVKVPLLTIKNNQFSSEITVREENQYQRWTTCGELNRSSHTIKAELYSQKKQKVYLPYLKKHFEAEVMFDSLSYSLTKTNIGSGQIALSGVAAITGLQVLHHALSPDRINLDRGKFSYHIHMGSNFAELDSSSHVQFNKLEFHPYLYIEKKHDKWHIKSSINKPWFPANELFGSLPKGLFSNLEGIQTKGMLSYHFLFDLDFSQLDSLKLESELNHKDFHIIKYGATNLAKMSEEFSYTAYEKEQPVKTFNVGPSYEHFTPLDSISPLLQMSVLQSEDGAFFYHKGFLPDALREALIYDLKVKRFARGGSTITMQLVKNVFLNRKKNIARKLEEALIVWLIETKCLTSKQRMYEVYLNIAEWGPMVYGIYEAADYYFSKRPSELTTEESIFLASIIPKPKHYKSSFTTEGQLKDYMKGYYHLIANRLKVKGLISELDADSIKPEITIRGGALNDLRSKRDSIPTVSTE